jgi:acetylornithine deacetylase/succinyl-diaminopimelate desuccinylase-like protein
MLSPVELRVIESHDRQRMIALAMDLARIPSLTTEESPVSYFLADYPSAQGFTVEVQEVEPGRAQCIGRLPGSGGGKSLMVNGHVDVDPITNGWNRDPWTPAVEGDRLYGHGLLNMKGGIAAMIEVALKSPEVTVRARSTSSSSHRSGASSARTQNFRRQLNWHARTRAGTDHDASTFASGPV